MDINNLLKGIDCACGKHHSCDIEKVYIERDAAKRLPEILEGFEKILLVADENTIGAYENKVYDALSEKTVTSVIFPGSKLLVPDEDAVAEVTKKLGDAEIIVGVGSGVIQDLSKYVSFENKLPYVIVATAPSMDGYASTGAAMIMGGMKVTYSAHIPKAFLADTLVLKDAPMDLIKSGYGDIIGKFSALNDWKLSHIVNGEYFCQYIYDLTFSMVQDTLKLADGLLKRDEESIKTLTEALIVVGIAMSFAGSSRPASGSEHHLSHFYEIVGILNDEPYLLHGTDVAYSTVATAKLREKLLECTIPEKQNSVSKEYYESQMNAIYKSAAAGCMELQDKMGRYSEDRMPTYKANWDKIKEILKEMPTASEIEAMLAACDMKISEFTDIYSAEKIEKSVWFAKDLKDRYTVLWLYWDFFADKL